MGRASYKYSVLIVTFSCCITTCTIVRNKNTINKLPRLVLFPPDNPHQGYFSRLGGAFDRNYHRRNWISPNTVTRLSPLPEHQKTFFDVQKDPYRSEKFVSRLPNHYMNLHNDFGMTTWKPNRNLGGRNKERLPIFEQAEDENNPMTIYRGLKAELIFNTVMNQQYKMWEPIPGQIIRPPIVPLFKSGLSQRAHWTSSPTQVPNKLLQVRPLLDIKKDMIPFYAHEAINPLAAHSRTNRNSITVDSHASASDNQNIVSTTKWPKIVYAIPYSKYMAAVSNRSKNISNPFASQYTVQQPATPIPDKIATAQQINSQLSPPADFFNIQDPSTTPIPKPTQEHVILVMPFSTTDPKTTRKKNIHCARHAGFKSYFPLPIHTLNKLIVAQKRPDLLKETTKIAPNKGPNSNRNEFNQPARYTDGIKKSSKTIIANRNHNHDADRDKDSHKRSPEIKIVPIAPNFAWIILDSRDESSMKLFNNINFDDQGPPLSSTKYSSSYRQSSANSLSTKFMPKIHASKVVLGADIMVE